MLLSELAGATAHEKCTGKDTPIASLQYNSRKVGKGDLFFCVVGTFSDGHAYAAQAVAAGAAALVVEHELPLPVPQVIVGNTRIAMAEMAAAFYGYPARGMRIVGVTGTNGKTSTTYMLKAIAEQCGLKVGLIGTIRNLIGERIVDTERTTPESVDLQRILREMKDEGVELVVMEASSHSLDQRRVHGIEFETAVFTNLTQDHLDYHKTFENYLAAKMRIFAQARQAVVNRDDPHAQTILNGLTIPCKTFGIREQADISASEIDITTRGVQFDMHCPLGTIRMYVPIPGLFSVFNAMGAAAAAIQLGLPLSAVKNGIETMGSVSGRLEPLPTGGRNFTVLLDYAHTPDALENILKTARGFAEGRIVTLFGCGGDRDHAKRPIMGEISGRLADYSILTSDNPRLEDPMEILREIEAGIQPTGAPYTVIENRREAIRFAMQMGKPGDVIVLAGKGHETYQDIGGRKLPFDEKVVVRELLSEMELVE